MRYTSIVFIAIFMSSVAFLACRKPTEPVPPPPYVRTIDLIVEDFSCTEAWLRVKLTDASLPQTIELIRDSSIVLSFDLTTPDSLLIDTLLSPHQLYSYKAYRIVNALKYDSSSRVSLTTLDTTGHDFVFQTFGWAIPNNFVNEFNDVIVLDDTLAYCCGRVYLQDSTLQVDSSLYNLAKWNGTEWKLIRILSYVVCGEDSQATYNASSVFAFGPNDVWIAMRRGQVARWNGTTQTAIMCLPQPFTINKIWGQSPNSVYAVGNNGGIAHYSNGVWQNIESGTTLSIRDVYGARHPRTGEYEVLCVASSGGQSKILKIEGSSVSEVEAVGLPNDLYSLWHIPGRRYVITGGFSAYSTRNLEYAWTKISNIGNAYKLSGSALNDITVDCPGSNLIWHFNGIAWHHHLVSFYGTHNGISLKRNTIIAVGQQIFGQPMNAAIMHVGRRN